MPSPFLPRRSDIPAGRRAVADALRSLAQIRRRPTDADARRDRAHPGGGRPVARRLRDRLEVARLTGKRTIAFLPGEVASSPHRTGRFGMRSEEHTSALQSLMRISYAVFCLK